MAGLNIMLPVLLIPSFIYWFLLYCYFSDMRLSPLSQMCGRVMFSQSITKPFPEKVLSISRNRNLIPTNSLFSPLSFFRPDVDSQRNSHNVVHPLILPKKILPLSLSRFEFCWPPALLFVF